MPYVSAILTAVDLANVYEKHPENFKHSSALGNFQDLYLGLPSALGPCSWHPGVPLRLGARKHHAFGHVSLFWRRICSWLSPTPFDQFLPLLYAEVFVFAVAVSLRCLFVFVCFPLLAYKARDNTRDVMYVMHRPAACCCYMPSLVHPYTFFS